MNELDKLKALLEKKGVPYFTDKNHFFPNVIVLSKTGRRRLCDAIISPECMDDGSCLEIMGALTLEEMTEENQVLGGLKAEEVAKRFVYCYKHNTSVYVQVDTIKK